MISPPHPLTPSPKDYLSPGEVGLLAFLMHVFETSADHPFVPVPENHELYAHFLVTAGYASNRFVKQTVNGRTTHVEEEIRITPKGAERADQIPGDHWETACREMEPWTLLSGSARACSSLCTCSHPD